jgi:hypothetical protein
MHQGRVGFSSFITATFPERVSQFIPKEDGLASGQVRELAKLKFCTLVETMHNNLITYL